MFYFKNKVKSTNNALLKTVYFLYFIVKVEKSGQKYLFEIRFEKLTTSDFRDSDTVVRVCVCRAACLQPKNGG